MIPSPSHSTHTLNLFLLLLTDRFMCVVFCMVGWFLSVCLFFSVTRRKIDAELILFLSTATALAALNCKINYRPQMLFSIFFPLISLVERGDRGNVKKITKFVIKVSYCSLIEKINSRRRFDSQKLDYFLFQSCVSFSYMVFLVSFKHFFLAFFPRLYHAEKISNTNLVFIISDSQLLCRSCDPKPLMQAEKPGIL